jgi:predicted porin
MGKKNKKNEELKRFSVETTSTFYEVHIVHAKNEEEAKLIAASADYNFSKWLGQNFVNVREAKDKDIERFRENGPILF